MKKVIHVTYRQRLLINFFLILFAFATIVVTYQYFREKQTKSHYLQDTLQHYSDLINNGLHAGYSYPDIDSLRAIFPDEQLRVTIMDKNGKVLFDNEVDNVQTLDNHIRRPEIMQANERGQGYNIRTSSTTGKDYFYFARKYEDFFIRTSLEYNQPVINALKIDAIFLWVMVLVCIIFFLLTWIISTRLGLSISALKDFAVNAENSKELLQASKLPNDELGLIADKIFKLYKRLHKTSRKLSIEKDRLSQHFQYSVKGIAIFNKHHQKLFINSKFIQYANVLIDTYTLDITKALKKPEFSDISDFIMTHIQHERETNHIPYETFKLEKSGRYFEVSVTVFYDSSYKIDIKDITSLEKNRILKQDLTGNIAHELRTPITVMQGYLETLLGKEIDPEQQTYFLTRAHKNVRRLSHLIDDIAVVSKLEDAPDKFRLGKVNIAELIDTVCKDFQVQLAEKELTVNLDVPSPSLIEGNQFLLYSIFQNLIDNSIKYTSIKDSITIRKYLEDDDYLYFSYANSGESIDPKHLPRLFERFYRIESGRSRNTGGTGLGLSIVKNAVLFHGGEITAKIPPSGGLEFLFSLKKHKQTT